jgi:hypothetical protein
MLERPVQNQWVAASDGLGQFAVRYRLSTKGTTNQNKIGTQRPSMFGFRYFTRQCVCSQFESKRILRFRLHMFQGGGSGFRTLASAPTAKGAAVSALLHNANPSSTISYGGRWKLVRSSLRCRDAAERLTAGKFSVVQVASHADSCPTR